MDITSFIASKRDRALLIGDYDSYRSQLSHQLQSIRRRLGRTTPKNAKFTAKAPVTAADVASNHEFAHLLLVQADRAWAHAMHIKSSHAEDNASKGISGETRRHIITKLHKAAGHAKQLVTILSDRSTSKASDQDYLGSEAYALYLAGAEDFERQVTRSFDDVQVQKQAWSNCLSSFSEAHVIYTTLLLLTQKEVFRDFISGNVDPSIRYAAYQSKLPRTIAIPSVAKRNFRRDQQRELLAIVERLNPNALKEEIAQKASTADGASTVPIPTTISWRKRSAPIADAAIGQALAATALAASKLSAQFSSGSASSSSKPFRSQKLAASYDPVLNSAQDAVDAIRRSISDVSKEGVAESDTRMQDLRVSDLAANYALISWRIGRNRVLVGGASRDDGATFEPETSSARKSKASKNEQIGMPGGDAMDVDTPTKASKSKTESVPHALARLTTRIVLLDSTMQSIDSLSQLPGASRDAGFQAELSAQRAYYQALRSLNIGYSHTVVARNASGADRRTSHNNALALFASAKDTLDLAEAGNIGARSTDTAGLLADISEGDAAPLTLLISQSSLSNLRKNLDNVTLRQQGLCTLHKSQGEEITAAEKNAATSRPLVERLDTFPAGGHVDLKNLVTYPPKLEPAPVKPIFLDLAWNYIEYSGRSRQDGATSVDQKESVVGKAAGKVAEAVTGATGTKEEPQKKKGWFGFGR